MKDEIVLAAPIHVMDKLSDLLNKIRSLDNYGTVNKTLRIVKKGQHYYNLQGEMWRPDLNIEQAIDLANYFGNSITIEFFPFTGKVQTDIKKVIVKSHQGDTRVYNAYVDNPQADSTWANKRSCHKRNIARCIVHGCILLATGEPIEPYIWSPSV